MKKKSFLSFHLIGDFKSPKFIENPAKIKQILWEAAKRANNTPLKVAVHKFPHQGITGVVILAESHIAIHTWPEYGYLAIDIFTCGKNTRPYTALEYLKKVFLPKRVRIKMIKRG
ncbi:MAG: adenosylmethionine decarboxylase [Candidatus Omnitrophica bacterium]|nr:adenosylmethionine decarboxylase [Candidatus Omnitrophota bacterium]MCM8793129.1 adenosylmethionine decarboxylase [Candidatus Omnitrophota bacterium]